MNQTTPPGAPPIRSEGGDAVGVRQAVLSDLQLLVPLFDGYRQFYGRAPDPAGTASFLRARFDHGESILFLASAAGNAVGFTQLYPAFSSVSMARVFILNDLFVVPSCRKRGVASKLLDAAVEHARSLGAVRVTLNTDVANTTAQAVYAARGWQRDQEYYAYHLSL